MSTKNFRKKEGRTGVPGDRYPNLVKNLNKFYELCGGNDSEAGRRLGVKPQQFNEWRKGQHVPTRAARKHIAAVFKISEHQLLQGKINEPTAHSGPPPLSKKAQRLVKRFEKLMATEDPKLLTHFEMQLDYVEKAVGVTPATEDDKE